MYPGAHAQTQPDKPALIMAGTGRTVTYAELDERSNRLAQWWYAVGLRTGDGVAMLLTNTAEVLEIYWAAIRSGLYVTAINYNLSADEASYIVNDANVRSLIVHADLAELATQVAANCPDLGRKLAIGPVDGYADYEATLAGSDPAPLAHEPRGADMLYSSGTTGRPKGIRLPIPGTRIAEDPGTVTNLIKAVWGFGSDTVYLSPAPMYHAAPLRFCVSVTSLGGTVVMMEKFDPAKSLALIEAHRVTHSQWVPTHFVRMLKMTEAERAGHDVSSMRIAIHAAAPCPVEVKAQMIDWWGPIVHEYYASTETNGMTVIGPDDWLKHPGTVGRPVLGIVRICAEDGSVCETGEAGDVYFERDFIPFEYHHDPERTTSSQHPGHPTWTTVGDMGYLDPEGYLFLTDRKAFMIISGGVNIYPQEIEDALALHPAVFDVAVIGIPDPEMGERVKAFVQPAVGTEPGPELEAELVGFLRERIAGFKIPRVWEFRTELPRTPTGKLQKGLLKEKTA
ncbi:acyl-CoA synthetase [Sporichthya sp.]|uniref:acyl-CoA synthetase n=1 Tax=Sporichthya sp. TaxID=65475 RepID=UPI0017FD211C|nr:acyl-CoA synthetase [Sporichthya sp.]MBA3743062.1 acyl-CoA synthetase [Sporichthya sp.]